MRKPAIILAFDEHRNREVVSLRFVKDFELIGKVKKTARVQNGARAGR